MTSHEYARGLVQMADFLSSHKEFDMGCKKCEVSIFIFDAAAARATLRAVGEFKKDYTDIYYFRALVETESATLRISIPRSVVCKPVKKLKEVDDWECEPLLPELAEEK